MSDVTVRLTSRNRAGLLAQTLETFTRLEVTGIRWDVMVVDNGSTDGTPQVLQAFRARLPLRTITVPQPGLNRARNQALPLVHGELILFTDDDVIPREEWLVAMLRAARRWPDAGIFGGRIVPLFPAETPDWLRTHPHGDTFFAGFTPDQPEGPIGRAPFGPNFAIRSTLLAGLQFAPHLGPTDGAYPTGGETELVSRLMSAGHRVIYVPSAEVGHVVRPEQLGRRWLFRRAFNWGRGFAQVAHRSSRAVAPRHVVGWQMLTCAALFCAFAPFSRQRTIEYGGTFHFLRGELSERRRIDRARRAGQGAS